MRRRVLLLSVVLLVFAGELPAAEPKLACPSLDGYWSGQFDGPYSGTWAAAFTQTGRTIRAAAIIKLRSGQQFEARGTAQVLCEGKKTTLAGSGSAKGKSGSFEGLSDDKGTHLSGTWSGGKRSGTWRGERAAK